MKPSSDHHVAREISALKGRLLLGRRTSPSDHSLIDAEEVIRPKKELIEKLVNPSLYKDEKLDVYGMLSIAMREDWLSVLGNRVITKNYLAVDNNFHIKSVVDAIVQWDGKRYVCKFSYVSPKKFRGNLEKGPFLKDVFSVQAACRMVSCYDGLIFYQSKDNVKIFHIEYDEDICEKILKKCISVYDDVLSGGLSDAIRRVYGLRD